MAKFSVPKSPSKSTYTMSTFQGCDFTNSPATVDETKSPNCINMVRDVPGKIRKSMGYHTMTDYTVVCGTTRKVNGSHYLRSSGEQLIHVGNLIISGNAILYNQAANHISKSWQFGDRLFIQDGTNLLVYYKEKIDDPSGGEYWGEHQISNTDNYIETTVTFNRVGDSAYFLFSDNVQSATANGSAITASGKQVTYTSSQAGATITFRFTLVRNTGSFTILVGGEWGSTIYARKKLKTYDNNAQKTPVKGVLQITRSDNTKSTALSYGEWTNNSDSDVYVDFYPANLETTSFSAITTSQGSSYICDLSNYYQFNYATYVAIDEGIDPGVTPKITQVYGYSSNGRNVTFTNAGEGYWYSDALYDDFITSVRVVSSSSIVFTVTKTVASRLSKNYWFSRENQWTYTCRWNRQRQPGPSGYIDATDGTIIDSLGQIPHVKKVSEIAYIPTVTEGKLATGGGTSYEPLNLLQPYFIETFYGSHPQQSGETVVEVEDSDFKMSFAPLDSATVKVWVLNSSGEWIEKTEGTHFSVYRETGIIHFATKPGQSPIDGTPNVKVQAARTVEGYADKINKCTISIPFGVNGNGDRLFVSGNPDYYNQDWWCQKDDPTYWGDTWYSSLGSPSSKIVGYSIISNYLAAHKDDYEKDANIILREGNFVDNDAVFPIVASLQGAGAIAPWSFSYLETEPVFLTKRGIYAVTAQDITGEKYSQNRSYYLDGKLLEERNLENAYACIYNDFYILALNSHLYILDGLQPVHTDKSMPYATRQYAGFYRENVPATCMWTFNDELYFGTEDGKVCKFYKDKYALESYNDNGAAIECVWESPDLDGRQFFKNKTFRYLAIRLDSAISTSINVYAMKRGIWNFLKFDNKKARYFTFPTLDFSRFSFSTDETQKIIHTKIRLKKLDKARFRLTNTNVNEPFGLYDVALEYIENGNYKG